MLSLSFLIIAFALIIFDVFSTYDILKPHFILEKNFIKHYFLSKGFKNCRLDFSKICMLLKKKNGFSNVINFL